jgi:hypothetical protein
MITLSVPANRVLESFGITPLDQGKAQAIEINYSFFQISTLKERGQQIAIS